MDMQKTGSSIYEAVTDNPAKPAKPADAADQVAGGNIIDFYEASGMEPDSPDVPNKADTGPGAETAAEITAEELSARLDAAGMGINSQNPRCLFYACFACKSGHCTALNDTNFHGRPCPFFKTEAQAKKNQQDAFDRLLIGGRLDIINRYEELLVDLGIENPEDAGEGPLVIDDDILAARAELEGFRRELDEADAEADLEAEEAEKSEEDMEKYGFGEEKEKAEGENDTGADFFS